MRIVGYPVAMGDDPAVLSVARYRIRSLSELCGLLETIEKGEEK